MKTSTLVVFRTPLLGLLLAFAGSAFAQQTAIHTVAGGGTTSTTTAPGLVTAFATDLSGNLLLAFSDANVVMRLNSSGTLAAVAGNGTAGYSGDNGAATSAQLNSPTGIAVDSSGNIYIADSLNNRVRKVASNGTITTVAGDGTPANGGDGGLAIVAQVGHPVGVALDSSGNLYILQADPPNSSTTLSGAPYLRKVTNGVISTVTCGGCSSFGSPFLEFEGRQIAADSSGDIFFAYVSSVQEVSSGTIKIVAGVESFAGGSTPVAYSGDGGPAINAHMNSCVGVFVDSSGNLYIADTGNNRIRKVGTNGVITTVAGNGIAGFSGDGGAATSAELNTPLGVTVDSLGNLYIMDSGNQRIRKVANGLISTVLGSGAAGSSGDGGAATGTELSLAPSVVVDTLGNLYIAELGSQRVRKVSNGVISTVAGNGSQGYSGDNGPATSAQLNGPIGLALDSAGNLYIADVGNSRIRKVANGTITTVAGNGTQGYSGDGGSPTSAALNQAVGIAVNAAGDLFIADTGNQAIRKVSGGLITTVAGNGIRGFPGSCVGTTGVPSSSQAQFNSPTGLTIDTSGAIYVADTGNEGVVKILNSVMSRIAGICDQRGSSGDGGPAISALLNYPVSVAVDKSGNVYIADGLNQRVRKVSNGVITTVAGTGATGFSGDGGAPINAQFTWPSGVAVDANGNLYIADAGNKRIREVTVTPTITALAPPSALAGGAAFTLTVNGNNFQTGSIVQWNSTALTTTFVTATQLTSSVSPSLIASIGNANVTVVNGQVAPSNAVSFSVVAPFSLSSAPTSVTIPSPGGSTSAVLTATPATGFSGTVSISCAITYSGSGTPNDPPGCSLSASQLSITAPTAGTTAVTITTTAAQAAVSPALRKGLDGVGGGSVLAGVLMFALFRRRPIARSFFMALSVMCFVGSLTGCGGKGSSGGGNPGTSLGSYNVTITVTSANYSTTLVVPLTVQ